MVGANHEIFSIWTDVDFRASLLGFGSLAALENNKNLGKEEDIVVDTSGRESLAHNMEGSMKRKESVRRIKAGVSRMINTLSRGRCGTSFAVQCLIHLQGDLVVAWVRLTLIWDLPPAVLLVQWVAKVSAQQPLELPKSESTQPATTMVSHPVLNEFRQTLYFIATQLQGR